MSVPTGPAPTGILLVDKPEGLTSHDVVSRTRKALQTKKVGHAGTLDPMATGLLVLGVGSATRLLTFLVGADKEYLATIRLGQATVTDDREGDTVFLAAPGAVSALSDEEVRAGILALTGDIVQRPSSVSAIKVDGKRAYDRVRSGEDVELAGRPVTVSEFDIVGAPRRVTASDGSGAEFYDIDVRVVCSSGTYIRALARDLGAGLSAGLGGAAGVGGHLTSLRRTRVGAFSVDDATTLGSDDFAGRMLTSASVAGQLFPTIALDPAQTIALEQGKRVRVGGENDAEQVAALAPDGRLIGIVRVKNGETKVIVNFPTPQGANA